MSETIVKDTPAAIRPARVSNVRCWLLCGGCFGVLVALLFLDAFAPLEEWAALVVGLLIMLAFLMWFLTLALASGATAEWRPDEE